MGEQCKHELIPVSFHKDTLYLVEHQGQPYTPVKPIAENLGISWASQTVKLQNNPKRWGTVSIITTLAADGKSREMLCLPLRKLPVYLLSIDPRKVKESIRFKLEIYQEECDDALWAYWNQGVAVNPRAMEPEGVYYSAEEQKEIVKALTSYAKLLEAKIPPPRPKKKQSAKMTNEQACMIYDLEKQGYTQKKIAEMVGRSTADISKFLQYRPALPLR